MKNALAAPLALLLLGLLSPCCCAADTAAASALVYEPYSATVLYEKNADERMLIASTTKIMTALIVLENCGLNEAVEVRPEHTAVEGSSMYLKAGERYTVEELLLGLMLASGNDAAAALAQHTAGSMEDFAALMNEKCRELGLKDSHFVNSHGLDAEGQYSTARELAIITAAAMENSDFCRFFSTGKCSIKGLDYRNHNKLLDICPGCIGGKTGYTEKAGRILVSCVQREGMRLICVTISDPRDWDDHLSLYDECFARYEFIPLGKQSVPVVSGREAAVGAAANFPGFVAEKAAGQSVEIHLPRFVFAPVRAGESAGWAELKPAGGQGERLELIFSDSVASDTEQKAGMWEGLLSRILRRE